MPKFKFGIHAPAGDDLRYLYDGAFDLTAIGKSRMTIENASGDIRIIGKNFRYDGAELIGGTVTKVIFEGPGGVHYGEATGLDIKAARVPDFLASNFDFLFAELLLAGGDKYMGSGHADTIYGGNGKDFISGLNGNDIIDGGLGDDTYKGGPGSDRFLGGVGQGRDVVLDFKAGIDGGEQDYVGLATPGSMEFEIRKSGKDTIVDWGDGDMLVLVGVRRADISEEDFWI